MSANAWKIAGALAALWWVADSLDDGAGDCGYQVTQADHDAVEASLFVHPLDWLLPPVGACIPSALLGGEDAQIPGTAFTWKDASSRSDGPLPYMWRPNALILAENLTRLGQALGKTIKINSWWRGPKASRSSDQGEFAKRGGWGGYHPSGGAADIRVSGMSKDTLWRAIQDLISQGVISDGGLGIYAAVDSVHYDVRGALTQAHGGSWARARWDRRPDPVTGVIDYSGGL